MAEFDYSEYQLSEYEKYKHARESTKTLKLDASNCMVSFSEREKTVEIHADPTFAYYFDDMIEEDKARTDIDEEKDREWREEGQDDEPSQHELALQKLCEKFAIVFHDQAHPIEERQNNHDHLEYANALSGSYIRFPLGEGLLDFCYADLKKQFTTFKLMIMLLSKETRDYMYEKDGVDVPEETPIKFKNREESNEFFDYKWRLTNDLGKDLFYSSLYTALFTPVILDADAKTVKRYLNYLLLLQNEFVEKLKFCFDADFYPSILGHLYPSERYYLYCSIYKGFPSVQTRVEEFSIRREMNEPKHMPFGYNLDLIKERFSMNFDENSQEYQEFVSAFCKKDDFSSLWLRIPRSINTEYRCTSIFDMLTLEFTKMLEADLKIRKCKRCGRYFIMKGNYDTNYCDRVAEGQTRSCQDLAAQENYKAKAAENPALAIYSKYYKRYAARVRSRQIKEPDFKKWKFQALAKRDECSDGKITVEEYVAWMEGCFPNRTPKA